MSRLHQLTELLNENPADGFLRHALALEHIKAGDDEKAQQVFELLLKEQPGYIGSYYHLAKLLERRGDEAAAIKIYQQGMQAAKAGGDEHAYNELKSAYEFLIF